MKTIEGEDFYVRFFKDVGVPRLIVKCKKCTWELDLNKLDTLLDISDEIEHHDEMCQTWSNHEASNSN